jgi:anthranilate synthase component 2
VDVVLVLDNYDSFTYNLVQYLAELGAAVEVRRNDALAVDDVAALAPEAVVVSPGPGRPEDAGITVELVRRLGPRLPILGVCLGHQAIGVAYGGRVVPAPVLMHGKTSAVWHRGDRLYAGLPSPFTATRYHSLCVDPEGLPPALVVTATADDGVIMGLRHREHPVVGVQFHPESILTTHGRRILRNFLDEAGVRREGGAGGAGDPDAALQRA